MTKRVECLLGLLGLVVLGAMVVPVWSAQQPLLAFSSDSIQPALDEAARSYRHTTGTEVKVTYCKQKQAFAQAKEQKGDLFFSGHTDAYENAKKEGLAREGTQRVIGYLKVAIAVPKGNPQKIASLSDLARPGVKVGLGDPATSQLGQVSEELLKKAGLTDAVHSNVVARGDCCSKVADLLISGKVEAVLGWASFSKWAPDKVETIPLPADLAKPLPVTGLVFATSKNPKAAARFISFLRSRTGKAIFAKYGYYPSTKS
jgi:molybdate transport system substrate-binding protein